MLESVLYTPKDEPQGLNFSQFETTVDDVYQLDKQVIDDICEKHLHFTDCLKKRASKVKNIAIRYNPQTNLKQTLSALNKMQDITVDKDIMSSLFVKGDFSKRPIPIKYVQELVPCAEKLLMNQNESYIMTALVALEQLLKNSGDDIMQLLTSPQDKQVDIAKEERIKAAELCL